MMRFGIALLGAAAALALAGIAGCGSSGGATGAASGRASVFVTDSFREDLAHVWTTVYRVELIPASGSAVVLFDDTAGHQIDLKTLRDATGARFSFLGSATIPDGSYTGVNVTVAPTMQLFRNGVAVGSPLKVDTSLPRDANGNPILTLTFASPRTLGASTTNLVIDFDLAHFIVRASGVLPALREGDGSGLGDRGRHNADEYHGAVSALSGTSPDLTFTITGRAGKATTVVTSASTAVFGTGTLADGVMVTVEGTLDTTTGNLVATRLEVCPAGPPPASASGAASALDATAGAFTLTVTRVRGFTPSATTVNVITTSATRYHADGGDTQTRDAFFTALAATPTVDAEGAYDAATNTLTATDLRVDNAANDGGWQHGPHPYRPGEDQKSWGHGVTGH